MNIFKILLTLSFIVLGGVVGYSVFAQDHTDIEYPVAELGNCANEQECRVYCDNVAHFSECIAFAEAHNLLTPQELVEARRFQQFGVESGPGGCVSESECNTYCENISNINECLAFAEEHDILDDIELDEARRVAVALRQGAQLPGGCTGKAQCEAYCEEPANINECLAFAEAAGFMSPEELEEAKRVAPFMTRGEMPGNCRGREECEAYCSLESNTEECVTFFTAAGFMTAEEAEIFRRTGGKGPGNCQGREECDVFCNNPANQQACFEFAKQHGILGDDDVRNIEDGVGRIREGFNNAPLVVQQCLDNAIGQDRIQKILRGDLLPKPEIGDKMRECFERHAAESIEHRIRESAGDVPPGTVDCIQRLLGDAGGRPTAEQERRIGEECFERPEPGDFEGFVPSDGEFHPDEFRDEFQKEFEQRQQEGFERQFEEEFQRQFEQQFDEEFRRQVEQQFPGGIPPDGFVPPDGVDIPEQFQEFLEQPIVPEIEPPPPPSDGTQEEPQARVPRESFFGAVVDAMAPVLKRWLPFLPL